MQEAERELVANEARPAWAKALAGAMAAWATDNIQRMLDFEYKAAMGALLEVWLHWLQARIAMIYKFGPLEAARSYGPISIATGMSSMPARLVLDTLRGTIDAPLSDPQAGCRQGYTTSQQALRMSMLLHQYGDGA